MKKKEKPDNTTDVQEEICSPSLGDYPCLEFFAVFLLFLSPLIVVSSLGGLLWGICQLFGVNISLSESLNLIILTIALLIIVFFIVCVFMDFAKYCKKLKKYLEFNKDKRQNR